MFVVLSVCTTFLRVMLSNFSIYATIINDNFDLMLRKKKVISEEVEIFLRKPLIFNVN